MSTEGTNMKATTQPATRFGWEGQTLQYVITVDGATEVLVPEKTEDGMDVRITEMRQTKGGVEANVAVDVTGPVFHCDALKLEARGASGMTEQVPVGVMTVPNCMLGGLGVVGALALIGAVFAIRWGGGAGWTLGILAALVALAGIGFVGFGLVGRFAGFPFGFSG